MHLRAYAEPRQILAGPIDICRGCTRFVPIGGLLLQCGLRRLQVQTIVPPRCSRIDILRHTTSCTFTAAPLYCTLYRGSCIIGDESRSSKPGVPSGRPDMPSVRGSAKGERRKSLTRLRVVRDGFACGQLAMIHSRRVLSTSLATPIALVSGMVSALSNVTYSVGRVRFLVSTTIRPGGRTPPGQRRQRRCSCPSRCCTRYRRCVGSGGVCG